MNKVDLPFHGSQENNVTDHFVKPPQNNSFNWGSVNSYLSSSSTLKLDMSTNSTFVDFIADSLSIECFQVYFSTFPQHLLQLITAFLCIFQQDVQINSLIIQ